MDTKRGRPVLPEGEAAEERLQVRAKAAEKAEWQAAADRAGMSLSAWIRDRLNRAAKR